MGFNFVRVDDLDRVVEIIHRNEVSGAAAQAAIDAMFHIDFVALLTIYDDSLPVVEGQVWDGDSFEDYVPPPLTDEEITEALLADISHLLNDVRWEQLKFVATLAGVPASITTAEADVQAKFDAIP